MQVLAGAWVSIPHKTLRRPDRAVSSPNIHIPSNWGISAICCPVWKLHQMAYSISRPRRISVFCPLHTAHRRSWPVFDMAAFEAPKASSSVIRWSLGSLCEKFKPRSETQPGFTDFPGRSASWETCSLLSASCTVKSREFLTKVS
jgi:hypothetical protein